MTPDNQRQQIDRNYDAFQRQLSLLIGEHRDRYALLRDGEIVGFFDQPGDAYDEGQSLFVDGLFSIQEVTDQPLQLGPWSVA